MTAPENTETPKSAPCRPTRPVASILAFLITAVGWVFLPYYYWVSAVSAVAGIIVSVVALRQPRGGWRNLALVAIVASSVLALVLIIFWGILIYLMKM